MAAGLPTGMAVRAAVDCVRCRAAPTASTSPLSRGLCRAYRQVHSRDQIPGCSARWSVRVIEHVAIWLSPGSQDGSHSAESRRESGGVWTVICPGKRHFANLLDSYRPARGLLHTEEVTGSIPVSPTQLDGRFRTMDRPFSIFRKQQSARKGTRPSTRPPQNLNLTSTLPIQAPGTSSVPFTL